MTNPTPIYDAVVEDLALDPDTTPGILPVPTLGLPPVDGNARVTAAQTS